MSDQGLRSETLNSRNVEREGDTDHTHHVVYMYLQSTCTCMYMRVAVYRVQDLFIIAAILIIGGLC